MIFHAFQNIVDLEKCKMYIVKTDRFPKKNGVDGHITNKHSELKEDA